MDFIPKVEEGIIEEEETNEIQEPTPRNNITEEDIFNEKPKLVIKQVVEKVDKETGEENPNFIYNDNKKNIENIENIEPSPINANGTTATKPVTKKKRVMSEEHKAKLAQARVKALESRRRNSAIKKEKKELEKAIKQQELDELRAKAGIRKKPVTKKNTTLPEPEEEEQHPVFDRKVEKIISEDEPPKNTNKYYTQEDLDKATLNAIMGYEKIRKNRKKEKEVELKKTEQERKLKEELISRTQPVNSTYGQSNYWDNCY